MEAEWARTVEGKLELDGFIEALHKAAAPIGVSSLEWEIRRGSFLSDEITYKFDVSDDRDEVRAFYARPVASAYVVIALFPAEVREIIALVHINFDGKRTRIRVESPSLRVLERLRAAMG
ncbi:hypothetical protein LNKW23_12730 [Paralimibaculum aggregatum]|uniref:Uncharacterized protein n=1 Tax=Paralimibaculum aggregatum TaxID=3036245 RepID=A0ABQ6LP58_9RHOB|nr:hypothetical protein [Limibaculum sp. NKW23]GMG82060.1 hypothetical protein LNKW23_12730 [Limibaculum sp. NKW23]